MNNPEFITLLTNLAYFNYSSPKHFVEIEQAIQTHLEERGGFMTAFSELTYESLDLRFYDCGDGEELYEEGGVISLLQRMEPLFKKLNVHFEYKDDTYEDYTHTLMMNGTKYFLAQEPMLGWAETFAATAQMINSELELKNSQERIYLTPADQVYMVFLTPDQFKLINQQVDKTNKLLTPQDWIRTSLEQMKQIINAHKDSFQ